MRHSAIIRAELNAKSSNSSQTSPRLLPLADSNFLSDLALARTISCGAVTSSSVPTFNSPLDLGLSTSPVNSFAWAASKSNTNSPTTVAWNKKPNFCEEIDDGLCWKLDLDQTLTSATNVPPNISNIPLTNKSKSRKGKQLLASNSGLRGKN